MREILDGVYSAIIVCRSELGEVPIRSLTSVMSLGVSTYLNGYAALWRRVFGLFHGYLATHTMELVLFPASHTM